MSPRAGLELETLQRALTAVGRLTAGQAAVLCGSTPQAAGLRLRRLVEDGEALAYAGAYWHPRCPRRGSRHREMVAEMYVRLAPLAPPWRFEPASYGSDASYRPDGWLVSTEGRHDRIALEADRGTERRGAWNDKLARFLQAHGGRMVVAVPDADRARRVEAWAQEAGVSALVMPATALTAEAVLAFINNASTAAQKTASRPDAPAERDRAFAVNGVPVPPARFFAELIRTGRPAGVERRAGYDVWNTGTPSKKRAAVRWRGRRDRIR